MHCTKWLQISVNGGARHGPGAIYAPPKCPWSGLKGESCEIFKFWSFVQSKSINSVCKLLQCPDSLLDSPRSQWGFPSPDSLGGKTQMKIAGAATAFRISIFMQRKLRLTKRKPKLKLSSTTQLCDSIFTVSQNKSITHHTAIPTSNQLHSASWGTAGNKRPHQTSYDQCTETECIALNTLQQIGVSSTWAQKNHALNTKLNILELNILAFVLY